MKDVLEIYDEVEIIRTKQKSTIKEVTKVETKRLTNGKVIVEQFTRYGLEGFGMTYTSDQLKYIGQKPIKESMIDSVIYDSLLAQKKFDYLRQLLSETEDTRPDGYCVCGGKQYRAYWKETSGLRCMDCGKIEY